MQNLAAQLDISASQLISFMSENTKLTESGTETEFKLM